MRHGHQGMLLLALLLALPQVAAAQETPDLTRIEVHTPTYDAVGRRIRDDVKRLDAEGFLVGTISSTWVYGRSGRLQTSETVTMDVDGTPTHAWNSTWDYDVEGTIKVVHRTRTDGAGHVFEREREKWTREPGALTTIVETEVNDGDGVLLRTRYQVIEDGPDGLLIGRDVSTFDATGAQSFRRLERWFRTGRQVSVVERWTFDTQDEPIRHEVADWIRDEKGRVVAVDTGIFDGEETLTGFTHEVRVFHPRNRRQTSRTLTWTDADDLPLRKMTEEIAYNEDGRVITRRVRWEHWGLDD